MAWIWAENGNPTRNKSTNDGAECMYTQKEVKKAAGWTVQMSGDGIGAYMANGDVITHFGPGANGLGNSNAWFRIQDPGGRREFVHQRGAQNYSWVSLYSALDKFTGGAPATAVIPTATDQQYYSTGLVTSGFKNIFPTVGSWRFHCTANNAPEGNVYPFWTLGRTVATGLDAHFNCCLSLIDTLSPAADTDKCMVMAIASSDLDAAAGAALGTSSSDMLGWQRMNMAGEEFGILTAPYFSVYHRNMGTNPNSGDECSVPMHCVRGVGVQQGHKGTFKEIAYSGGTQVYGDLYYDGSEYWVVADEVLLRGWPDATLPIM